MLTGVSGPRWRSLQLTVVANGLDGTDHKVVGQAQLAAQFTFNTEEPAQRSIVGVLRRGGNFFPDAGLG